VSPMCPYDLFYLKRDSSALKNMKKFNQLLWLPFLNTYRTMCMAPRADFVHVLEEVRQLRFAA
jgi:hypothetical protein